MRIVRAYTRGPAPRKRPGPWHNEGELAVHPQSSTSPYVTRAELDEALAHFEVRIKLIIEQAVHAQTRQMFNLLLPVYGGIIIGLLLFIASKVL